MVDVNEPNWKSFAPITAYDKAGYVWIAVLYGMTISLLALAIRLWYKQRVLGKDDGFFIAASVAMLGHVICIIIALEQGLVTSVSLAPGDLNLATNHTSVGVSSVAAYVFLFLALALAKSSTIMFVQRILSPDMKRLRIFCYALVVFAVFWVIGSMVAVGISCTASIFMTEDMSAACNNQIGIWAAIAALDTATEFAIITMPIMVIWSLQLPFFQKLHIIIAFACRLGVVALSIVHAVYMGRISAADHPEIACVSALVIAECLLCWSLVSASIPNLKALMTVFDTGFGVNDMKGNTLATTAHASGSNTRSDVGHAVPLQHLELSRKMSTKPDIRLRLDHGAYDAEVTRGPSPDDFSSMRSGDSQVMIIHKTVDREVRYEIDGREVGAA